MTIEEQHEELLDELTDAIAESFDEEWTARDGARHVLWLLNEKRLLDPRAAGDDGELVKRLRYTYEHGIFVAAENGMLAGADEAADRITALSAEVERLRAWQNAALEVEPNIDLDIEQLGAKP
jgi:hypothetical protein